MSAFETNDSPIEYAPTSARKRAGMGLTGKIASAALILSLGFGGGAYLSNAMTNQALADDSSATATQTATTDATSDTTLAETVAAKVMPSVGQVYALVNSSGTLGVSTGSCVVLDTDGYIVTNYHIIEGADEVQGQETPVVQISLDDKTYDATIVGTDPTSDIALLKIDPGDDTLTPITFGDSDALEAGSWVMTVGHPKGQETSVSVGVVSGTDRTESISLSETKAYYTGVIQTDAMINSGSSGGAMVNSNGEFVGMTTYSATSTGEWSGMSYAIPSNYIQSAIEQLRANGVVAHPQLGISVADMSTFYGAYYNYYGTYDLGNSTLQGAYVMSVVEGSGADEAGVKEGDIVTAVDGTSISSADDLIVQVRKHSIGDTVTLTVERDNEEQDITVTLGSDVTADDSADSDEASDDSSDSDEGTSKIKSVFDYLFGNSDSDDESDDSSSDSSQGGRSSKSDSGSEGSDGYGYGDDYGYGYGNGYGYGYGNGYGSYYGSYGNPGYGYGYGSYGMSDVQQIGQQVSGTEA